MIRLSLFVFVVGLFLGCQLPQRKQGLPVPTAMPQPTPSAQLPELAPAPLPGQPSSSLAPPAPEIAGPKIGLILGPGALRSFAHVGVVQELVKMRLPIQAVVGIEMSSIVAAIYANKGQPYDVEWQMMKLKESDLVQKGFVSGEVSPGDVQSLSQFLNLALSTGSVESSKVHFACPALNLSKNQIFMMSRGGYADLLPYCVAFPPLFKAYKQNAAAVLDIKSSVDYLRSKGAGYIVYVDLLSGPAILENAGSESQALWGTVAQAHLRSLTGIDQVIKVPLQDYDLLDFNRRREMIQKGSQAAREGGAILIKRLGL